MKNYLAVVLLCSSGCAGEGTALNAPSPEEAAQAIPTFLALHTTVIARSCSPNPGVCHQSNNYPDLATPGGMLAMIGMPCNLELPDPAQGWDGCEPKADRFRVHAPVMFESAIAWKEQLGVGRWKLALEKPAPIGLPEIRSSEVLLSADPALGVSMEVPEGSAEVILSAPPETEEDDGFAYALDAIMAVVAAGDPNRNGVFGWDDPNGTHGALIHPGSTSKSYLFGRITGTVPGTRMPLANQPLSNAEYLALACWIEGLGRDPSPRVNDPIDYQNCLAAKMPVDYAIGSLP